MWNENRANYIANLHIGAPPFRLEEDTSVQAVDINNLPAGIVTGSNLIQFPSNARPEIKSGVALSLLAAQRVATTDTAIAAPQQWVDRHNLVLGNLGWQISGGGHVASTFKNINVAVNQAIIPFLEAAFGPAATAGVLILTALRQLREMDKNSPWITLFDRESRHFNVTEYQFSVVQVVANQVVLRLASARFDASFGGTQVLFFKVTKEVATFDAANTNATAEADVLAELNDGLKTKLAAFVKTYIQSLPI
jgi:hypothetical protein